MSGEQMWDSAIAICNALSRADAEREKLRELRERAQKRCGSCIHWMLMPQCPREVPTRGGHKGPHMNEYPCQKFSGKPYFLEAVAALDAEIGKRNDYHKAFCEATK